MPSRISIEQAARAYGVDPSTLARKVNDAGVRPVVLPDQYHPGDIADVAESYGITVPNDRAA